MLYMAKDHVGTHCYKSCSITHCMQFSHATHCLAISRQDITRVTLRAAYTFRASIMCVR